MQCTILLTTFKYARLDRLFCFISVEFFRSLDIKWIKVFVDKLKALRSQLPDSSRPLFRLPHQISKDVQESDEDEMLSWREYFTLFLEIDEALLSEAEQQRKSSWHPACSQFSMTPLPDQSPPAPPAPLPPPPPPSDADNPPDDFTEDEGSQPGEEGGDGEEGPPEEGGSDRPAVKATLVRPPRPALSRTIQDS